MRVLDIFARIPQWIGVSDRPGRIRSIEGIRGLAMTLVFFVHVRSLSGAGNDLLVYLGSVARCGTDLFLLLCGFVIYESLCKRPVDYWPFVGRRVWRIYPLYVTVLCAYIAVRFAWFHESVSGAMVVENLLFLPPVFGRRPLILVSWTLTQIMACYLLTPLLVKATAGWTRKRRVLAFSGFLILWYGGGPLGGVSARPAAMLLGVVVNELYHWRPRFRYPGAAIAVAAAAFCGAGLLARGPREILIAIGLVAFIAGTLRGDALAWMPLRCLGAISYSYYLSHGPVTSAVAALLPNLAFWLLAPLAYACSVVAAGALYLAVERPLSYSPSRQRAVSAKPLAVAAAAAAQFDSVRE